MTIFFREQIFPNLTYQQLWVSITASRRFPEKILSGWFQSTAAPTEGLGSIMWRTGATSEKCFTHYFAKILFLGIILELMRDISFTKFPQIYFLVTWHDMGVPLQNNPTLLSSSQSPKPTFNVRWGPCLVSSQTRLQHSEGGAESVWSLVLSYWSMQQLANLVKSQTCKESHVHDNVLVFLPNCKYTYQKSIFTFLKICTSFMIVQGRLCVQI